MHCKIRMHLMDPVHQDLEIKFKKLAEDSWMFEIDSMSTLRETKASGFRGKYGRKAET